VTVVATALKVCVALRYLWLLAERDRLRRVGSFN